ncbi:MAG: right-handed parallel beta-helix repeat-containing protein [Candidatus Eisenbacteria sp.]|nr:right-handed parallel beta-helix repeat-containing protein [Candidatus Eisenbacteria bacterium]
MLHVMLVAVLLLSSLWTARADTYLVLPDGSGDVPTIQAAIDSAAHGDVILLGNGTFIGQGNRDLRYRGKRITVQSESDDPSTCTIDCQGSYTSRHRGFIFTAHESSSSVLQGITIANGYVHGSPVSWEGQGGAIYCEFSSPSVSNCIFRNNSALTGGAVTCDLLADAVFTDCVFEENESRLGGNSGGMYSVTSSPILVRCVFAGNISAGVFWRGGQSLLVQDCTFSDHASRGLYCEDADPGGTLLIEGCRFLHNGEAGVRLYGSTQTLSQCSFWENHASNGGALKIEHEAVVTVTDCLFYSNRADESGGAVWCETGSASFINCTMADNEAANGAGGIDCGAAAVSLENTIVALSTLGGAISGSAALSCCDLFGNEGGDWVGDIAGQYGTDGNISEDPLFCDPMNADYTIQEDSPCAPFSMPNPECDLIGAQPIGCPPPAAIWPTEEKPTWGGLKALFRQEGR